MSGILRWAGSIAAGTAVGQGIVMLATPWLARVYTPADFGGLALVSTVSNLAATAGPLRFDLAVPTVPASEVRGLVAASLGAAAVLAAAAGIVVLAAGRTGRLAALPPGVAGAALVAGGVFLPAAYQAAAALLLRRRSPAGLGFVRGSQGVLFTALAATRAAGLLWAHVLSWAAGLVALREVARRRRPDDVSAREAVRRHWRYPALSLPGAVLDVVGYSQVVWVITAAYGAAALGQYAQVQRLIAAPLMLVSASLGQVLLRNSAPLADDPTALAALAGRVFSRLCAAAAVLLAAVAVAGEPALRLVLGGQWLVDGGFLFAVALAVCVRACVSPLSVLLLTRRRFDLALGWQAAYCVSAATMLRLAAGRLTFREFCAAYAAHEVAFYAAYSALIWYALRSPRVPLGAAPAVTDP